MIETTTAGAAAPAEHRSLAVLTPRGTAVLAILRAQDLVRALDAADRAYVAPYAGDLLVECCTEPLGITERP